MKFGCNWKRKGDKTRYWDMEFNSALSLSNFFENLLEKSNVDEVLEIKIWEIK